MKFRFTSLKNIFGKTFGSNLNSVLESRSNFTKDRAGSRGKHLRPRSLHLEQLEDRQLLSVTTVDTWLDVSNDTDNHTTLREAIVNAESGDTIKFGNTVDWDNNSIKLDTTLGQLVINKSLTIDASGITGGVTIDAQRCTYNEVDKTWTGTAATDGRVFLIDDGIYSNAINVTMNNLTIKGGNVSASNGGGIYNRETLTLNTVTVTENKAEYGGGGIYTRACEAKGIEDDGDNTNYTDITETASLILNYCTVSNNTAAVEGTGGGIMIITADSRDESLAVGDDRGFIHAEINYSTITGNYSEWDGGFSSYNGGITLSIKGSKINNNTSLGGGAGIGLFWNNNEYTHNPTIVTIENTEIRSNNQTSKPGDTEGDKDKTGGIQVTGDVQLEVINSVIADNTITYEQDGISKTISRDFSIETREDRNSSYISAKEIGVSDSIVGTGITLGTGATPNPVTVPEIVNSVVGESSQGGVISLKVTPPDNLDVTEEGQTVAAALGLVVTTLDDNETVDDNVSLREAIAYATVTEGLENPVITFADGLEGTINLQGTLNITKSMTIAGTNLSGDDLNITIDGNGQQIFNISDGTDAAIEVGLESLTLTGGASLGNGGAIYNMENLTIEDSSLYNNSALYGGAIYNDNGASLTVLDSTLYNNTANGGDTKIARGGGIYNANGEITVINSTFYDNTANKSKNTSEGGGIFNESGKIDVLNSIIVGNNAKRGADLRTGASAATNLVYSIYKTKSEHADSGSVDDVHCIVASATDVFGFNIFTNGAIEILNDGKASVSGALIGENENGIWYYDVLNSGKWVNSDPDYTGGMLVFDPDNTDDSYGLGENGVVYDSSQNAVTRTATLEVFNVGAFGLKSFQLLVPGNITATPLSSDTIRVTWSPVIGASSYTVKWGEGENDNKTISKEDYSSDGFNIEDLTPNSQYNITVQANGIIPVVSSAASVQVTGATTLRKAEPRLSSTSTTIRVEWERVDGATSYIVSWSSDNFTTEQNSGSISNLSYTIENLDSDKDYWVKVRAVKFNNTSDRDSVSEVVSIKTLLGAPSNLSTQNPTSDSIDIKWDSYENASYEYQYRIGTDVWSDPVSVSTESVTVTELSANTQYEFQVRAVRGETKTEWSTSAYGTTQLATPNAPWVTGVSSELLIVKWTEVLGATKYTLVWNISDTIPTSLTSNNSKEIDNPTDMSYKITGLNANTDYYVWIKAGTDTNDSVWSEYVKETTWMKIPDAPTVTAVSSTSLAVSWSEESGATKYTLVWNTSDTIPTDLTSNNSKEIDNPTDLFYTITNLTANTDYYVWIAVGTDTNSSFWSTPTKNTTWLSTPEISVADAAEDSITITWEGIDGATGYTAQYKVKGAADWIDLAVTINGNAYTGTATGLTADRTYEFQVQAIKEFEGETVNQSAWASAEGKTLNSGPDGLVVTVKATDSITIEWDADTSAESYEYQWKENNGVWDDNNIVTVESGTTATIGVLESNTKYTFRVRSVYDDYSYSAWSTEVSGSTLLEAPEISSSSKPLTSESIQIFWTDPNTNPADSYIVTCGDAIVDTLIESEAGVYTATITGLDAYTKYTIGVQGKGSDENDSTEKTIDITTKLATPTELEATSVESNTIVLSWGIVSGATRYLIAYNNNGAQEMYSDSNSVTISDLSPNTEYSFTVQALSESTGTSEQDSSFSEASVVTTRLSTPVISVTEEAERTITITWNGIDDATGYTAQYKVKDSGDGWIDLTVTNSGNAYTGTAAGLTADTTYEFQVQAIKEFEGETVNQSAWASAEGKTLNSGPDGLVVTVKATDSITIEWDADTSAESYEYQWKENNGVWDDNNIVTVESGTTATIGVLESNTKYTFRVRSVYDDYSYSAWSTEVSGSTLLEAPEISSSSKPLTSESIQIFWTDPNTNPADSYIVTCGDAIVDTLIESEAGVYTATITGLDAYTKYTIGVQGKGSDENDSTEKTIDITTKLATPTELEATSVESNTIVLSWGIVSGATRYLIAYNNNGAQEMYSDSNSVTISDLSPNTEYSFTVQALSESTGTSEQDSSFSEASVVTTRLSTPVISVTEEAERTITITWNGIDDATGYTAQYKVKDSGDGWIDLTVTNSGNAYTGTAAGLTADTTYEFQVQAIKEFEGETVNQSAWASAEGKTLNSGPDGLVVTVKATDSITIEWDADTSAESYEYQWKENNGVWDDNNIVTVESGTTATIVNLESNTKYTFRVRSVYDDYSYSAWSTEVSGSTLLEAPEISSSSKPLTSESIQIFWTDPNTNPADSYIVTCGDAIVDTLIESEAGVYTATITGLDAYTKYTIGVQGKGSDENDSTEKTIDITTKLATPTELEATSVESNTIVLSWGIVSGATRYLIAYNNNGAQEMYSDSNSVTISDLSPNTEYSFTVQALSNAQDASEQDSELSAPLSVTTLLTTPSINSTAVTNNTITITWNGIEGAAGYTAQYKVKDSGDGWIDLTVTNSENVYTGTATDLSSGTTYDFQVQAAAANGNTSEFATGELTTKLDSFEISVDAVSENSISVSWENDSKATDYTAKYCVEPLVGGQPVWQMLNYVYDPSTERNTGMATGLETAKTYIFEVQANKDGVTSSDPVQIFVDTLEADPLVVTTLDDIIATDGKISLREAINYVNANDDGENQTITFDESLSGTIYLKYDEQDARYGTLVITKSVSIDASNLWNSEDNLPGITISGINEDRTSQCRIFEMSIEGEEDFYVNLYGLKLTGGFAVGSLGDAILATDCNLTLSDCYIADNKSMNDDISGTALVSFDGNLTVRNTTFTGNSGDEGGAIYNAGTAFIENSTFYKNSASLGSAIYNELGSSMTIVNSTFCDNTRTGIYNNGELNVVNSILVGNTDGDIYTDEKGSTHFDYVLYGTEVTDDNADFTAHYSEADITVEDTFANLKDQNEVVPETDGTLSIKNNSKAAFYGTFSGITRDGEGSILYWFLNTEFGQWENTSNTTTKDFDAEAVNYGLGTVAGTEVFTVAQNKVNRNITLELFNVGAAALSSVKLMDPANVSAEVNSGTKITVSWEAVRNAGSYNIYWGTDPTGETTESKLGNSGTSFEITDLQPGTQYYIWVEAAAPSGDTYITENSGKVGTDCWTNLVFTNSEAISSTEIYLNWTPVTDAVYTLEYKKDGESTWTVWNEGDNTNSRATVTGLTADTLYNFRVSAALEGAVTINSDQADIQTKVAAPEIVSIGNVDPVALDSYTLSWNASASSESINGWRIEYKQDDVNGWNNVPIDVNKDQTTYTFTGLESGKTYNFRVSALAAENHITSDPSEVETMLSPVVVNNVTVGNWKIELTIDSADPLTDTYNVYRSKDNTIIGAALVSFEWVEGKLTYTAQTAEEAAASWYYWIQEKTDSNISCIGKVSENPIVMNEKSQSAPADFAYVSSTVESVTLNWNAPADKATDSTYTLERSLNGAEGSYVVVKNDIASNDTTYTDNGLAANTSYWYRIKINASTGYSASDYTSALEVKTSVNSPLNVTSAPISEKSFEVSWTDDSLLHAGSYTVMAGDVDDFEQAVEIGTVNWTDGKISTVIDNINGDLTPYTTYYVWIKAKGIDAQHDSQWVKTMATTKINMPVLKSKDVTSKSITVEWDSVDNASKYTWQYRKYSASQGAEEGWSTAETSTETSMTADNLWGNTEYQFRVKAVLADGSPYNSNWATASVKTLYTNQLRVNTLVEDSVDGNSTVSLREAINSALEGNDGTTVTFDPTVFVSGRYEIVLTEGELNIYNQLSSQHAITIDAEDVLANDVEIVVKNAEGKENRIFNITTTTADPIVIKGLTISGGKLDSGYGAGIYSTANLQLENCTVANNDGYKYGGGIYSKNDLTLVNSQVSYNSVSAGNSAGAGIYVLGTLNLENTDVLNNTVTGKLGRGAGIYSYGYAYITDSDIIGNKATASTSNGGGIYNAGSMLIENSKVTDNAALQDGGGIYNFCNADLTLVNSVVAFNAVTAGNGSGGGMLNLGGTVTLVNTTVAGNYAKLYGGGVANENRGTMTLFNTIIAENIAGKADSTNNVYGTLIYNAEQNIISNRTDKPSWFQIGPRFNSDGTLSNRGAINLTPDSLENKMVNSGNNSDAADYYLDENSVDIAGNKRIVISTIDIGAYEYQYVSSSPTIDLAARQAAAIEQDDLFDLDFDFLENRSETDNLLDDELLYDNLAVNL